MHIINVTVRDKIATYVGDVYYVCGNSDFVVHFDFDEEWGALDVKTARFICEDGSFRNQVFSGSECPVPIISNTNSLRVGVFAGNLCTTTPARVPAAKSILCPGGMPAAPEDDTYNQIMQELNAAKDAAEDTAKTLQDAFGEGGLFLVPTTHKDSPYISYADRGQAEIRDAVAAGKTCFLVADGRVYTYFGDTYHSEGDCPTFIAAPEYRRDKGIIYWQAQVLLDGRVSTNGYNPAKTPNPYKLTIGGQTYDGSKAVSVDIPAILEDKQFVVTVVSTSTGWVSDRSRAEIDAAQAAGKACLMHFPDSGEVMTYRGGYKFASNVYINTASAPGLYYDWAVVNDDKTVDKYGGGPLTAYPGAVSSSKGTCYLRWNGSAWEPATVDSVKAELGGGGTVEVDATLTKANAAADAKVVGDRFTSLSEEKMNKVSGTAGQAVGYNSAGQMVAVPFVQYGTSSGGDSGDSGDSSGGSTVANNLIDASVGFFEGYSCVNATMDVNTLDVTPVKVSDTNKLYKKAIPLEPGETYAISGGWAGTCRVMNSSGNQSYSFTDSDGRATVGDGCFLYTVPTTYPVYYFIISYHSSSTLPDGLVIVKGTSIPASASTYASTSSGTSTTYLHDSIKVKGENVVGGAAGEDASSLFDTFQPTARKIQAYQSPTTLTLALMSDTHYADDNHNASDKLRTARLMGLLGDFCNVDLMGNLGDMVPGDVTEEETRNYLAKLTVATIQNAKCPVLFSRGNHDDNGWYSGGGMGGTYLADEIIDDKEWYQAVWGINAKHFVNDPNRPYGAYGYYDHEPSKIRVFVLNSEDLPYILESDGSFRYSSYNGHAFSNEQINFVANALKFSDKDIPGEWAALFLSHVPLDTTNDDGYRFGIKDALIRGHETMLAVIAAYRNGSSFSYTGSGYNSSMGDVQEDFAISVTVDYSSKGAGDVIGFISGHTHTDNFSRNVGHEYSLSHGYVFLGLMGSTDFATFVIDRENGRIASIKHGASTPDTTAGAAVDAPDTGAIADGEWTVNIDQFRPTGVNLYNGVSETYGAGYTFPSSGGSINLETLEMTTATENATYTLSKAVAVKPFTKYAIPSAFAGNVLAFGITGARSGYLTPAAGTDYKIITTGIRQYYLCFAFNSSYNHSGFAIKEIYDGLVFG